MLDFVLYRETTEGTMQWKLHVEAAEWLFSDALEYPIADEGYPFLKVCALLGLDPKAIREQALVLTRQDLNRFSAQEGPG
jgi:hypothetical protein